MAKGLSFFSFFIILVSLQLSFIVLFPIEARLLKSSRSHSDYFMIKEIEDLASMKEKSTTSALGPNGKRHRFEIVQTLKWAKRSGPSPGEGHKSVPTGSNL